MSPLQKETFQKKLELLEMVCTVSSRKIDPDCEDESLSNYDPGTLAVVLSGAAIILEEMADELIEGKTRLEYLRETAK